MKINELIVEQQLDEISAAQIGQGIGRAATATGKAIGATASGAVQTGKNFFQGLKKGWQAGQKAVAGDTDGDGTPDTGTAAPAGGTAAPAGGTGGTAAPAGGKGGASNTELNQIKSLVAKLNPEQKKLIAAELKRVIPAGGGSAPAGGKLNQQQQNALKAKIKGQRAAGKTTASQTGSGFSNYVKGGGGQTLAGTDAQGNPVFKQNVQRENVDFFSNFLKMKI